MIDIYCYDSDWKYYSNYRNYTIIEGIIWWEINDINNIHFNIKYYVSIYIMIILVL